MIILNTRLKELRNHLGLSQKDFGSKIFLSQDHISSLEKGRRSITDRSIKNICNEFNVNEEWLRSGKGSMFQDITNDISAPDHIKELLRKFSLLSEDDQKKMNIMLDAFISESKKEEN